ncbi:GNAT family N-acetyltransferase [Solilutibacter silvestris]|uniref:Acetyltransferase (GNAT) domain n=1 Tax=Solilutibacter silvestris TaxID=1645665 RepID=A0A2K1Q2T9_9GAMM|nr:GNAT family N-acetyltransferase [Lysobacter silvestris]PNS09343.1 Acetyltransferase (GNAT) domain [Lysobacter silvestris]
MIRRAVADDIEVLSALSRDTFTDTFGHCYTPDDLRGYLDATYEPTRYLAQLEEQGCAAWLLEDGGHAIGYAMAGPCKLPHADVQPGDMELMRLYIRGEHQNGGHGARLFDAAMAWIVANAPRSCWLGVWSENLGAQRFYQRHGFRKVGEYLYEVGAARDLEFIFRRDMD